MRYISGIEINKVRYIYLYLHTIAMMVIYHSDLYVLKDQIYILVNIQCNESRDIINLKIIICSGPAVTWLPPEHPHHPPVCAGVRYICVTWVCVSFSSYVSQKLKVWVGILDMFGRGGVLCRNHGMDTESRTC